MLDCWNQDPHLRPDFVQLTFSLREAYNTALCIEETARGDLPVPVVATLRPAEFNLDDFKPYVSSSSQGGKSSLSPYAEPDDIVKRKKSSKSLLSTPSRKGSRWKLMKEDSKSGKRKGSTTSLQMEWDNDLSGGVSKSSGSSLAVVPTALCSGPGDLTVISERVYDNDQDDGGDVSDDVDGVNPEYAYQDFSVKGKRHTLQRPDLASSNINSANSANNFNSANSLDSSNNSTTNSGTKVNDHPDTESRDDRSTARKATIYIKPNGEDLRQEYGLLKSRRASEQESNAKQQPQQQQSRQGSFRKPSLPPAQTLQAQLISSSSPSSSSSAVGAFSSQSQMTERAPAATSNAALATAAQGHSDLQRLPPTRPPLEREPSTLSVESLKISENVYSDWLSATAAQTELGVLELYTSASNIGMYKGRKCFLKVSQQQQQIWQ